MSGGIACSARGGRPPRAASGPSRGDAPAAPAPAGPPARDGRGGDGSAPRRSAQGRCRGSSPRRTGSRCALEHVLARAFHIRCIAGPPRCSAATQDRPSSTTGRPVASAARGRTPSRRRSRCPPAPPRPASAGRPRPPGRAGRRPSGRPAPDDRNAGRRRPIPAAPRAGSGSRRAHLLDEDPVAQALGAGALLLGLGELHPVAADVDLHALPPCGSLRRPPSALRGTRQRSARPGAGLPRFKTSVRFVNVNQRRRNPARGAPGSRR
jgi:hypothetical protein